MDPPSDTFNLIIVGLTLITLCTLAFKGMLHERALQLGPTRELGLSATEHLAGAYFAIAYVLLMMLAFETDSSGIDLVAAVFPFLLIGLMIGRANRAEGGLRTIGLIPRHPMRDLKWAAMAVPIGLLVVWTVGLGATSLSEWLGWPVETIGHEAFKDLIEDDGSDKDGRSEALIKLIISAVILAPLYEELVFRGVMQTCLVRLFGESRWAAVCYAAAMFAVTHAWVVPWQNLFPLFALGLVFGYVYERTGSLLTAVLAHAGFNAANIALVVLVPV